MLFNSFEFIFLFLPFAAIGFHLLRRADQKNLSLDWLIVCSLFFYAWGDLKSLPVLLASLLFNYLLARSMGAIDVYASKTEASARRKRLFIFGILANLSLLSYYKYLSNLPLGLSFFTLMQLIYLVDCYEGMIAPSTLREHALFAAFFPSVTMGPILRAKDFLSQFRDSAVQRISADQMARVIVLFCMGLFKKVAIADNFALIADAGYSSPTTLSMLEGWVSSVSYCLHLYYDFSGYSDMAIASALLLGIQIPINFNSPYQARSMVDFWTRWHISLSNLITNYMYTPIIRTFKKLTFEKAMLATFISMVVVGFWHGSSWGFIVFGALQGFGVIVNQYWKRTKKKLPDILAWVLTFTFINATLVFFRANSLPDAIEVLHSLINFRSMTSTETLNPLIQSSEMKEMAIPVLLGIILIFSKKNSNRMAQEFQPSWKNLIWASLAMIVSLVYLNSNLSKGFLYRAY